MIRLRRVVVVSGVVVLLLSNVGSVQGEQIEIVVPNGLETVEGDINWSDDELNWFWPNGFKNQFLFPASQFESLPLSHRLITGYRNRPDSNVPMPRTVTYDRLRISLSTTQKSADDISTLFQSNVGWDEVVVYDSQLTLSTENSGPPGGPKNFDYVTDFETPFRYDPTEGNLLIEVRYVGPTHFSAIDAHLDDSFVTLAANSPIATVSDDPVNAIPVYQFIFVPEPTSAALILAGLIGLLGLRRR